MTDPVGTSIIFHACWLRGFTTRLLSWQRRVHSNPVRHGVMRQAFMLCFQFPLSLFSPSFFFFFFFFFFFSFFPHLLFSSFILPPYNKSLKCCRIAIVAYCNSCQTCNMSGMSWRRRYGACKEDRLCQLFRHPPCVSFFRNRIAYLLSSTCKMTFTRAKYRRTGKNMLEQASVLTFKAFFFFA